MAWNPLTLSLAGTRRLPFVQQSEATECGLACLVMIACWHGYETDILSLRRRFPGSLKGMTLRQLIDVAGRLGLAARAVRCELDALPALRTPCILHWEFSHFVVLKKVRDRRAWIHDPAVGLRVLKIAELSDCFTGVALELTPAEGFTKKRERRTLRMSELWRWQPQTRGALARVLLLSLVIELFVLLSPYYMRLVVDQAILKGDLDLLTVLALGFGLVALFQVAAGSLRTLVLQLLGNMLSYEMGARLLGHLLNLPLDYFQKRNLGDLLQRFQSIDPIKQFIMTGGVATIIDGILGSVTLAVLLLYSRMLGMIVLLVVAGYVILRLLFLGLARRYATDAIVAGARQQTHFLETIRAVQTVKAMGGELIRESEWLNLYVAQLNSAIRMGNLGIAYQAVSGMLAGISDIAIVYLAAKQVIHGGLTIGIMTAFLAYKAQFFGRVMSLADQFIAYRMLDVQLDRVADIALADPERGATTGALDSSSLKGELEMRHVVFRYSEADAPVLNDLNLHIRSGEFVAVVGPSGQGKSTLAKLLAGLYTPSAGEVLVDGRSIAEVDVTSFRQTLGVVMQEDQLLAGSIADNIALFETSPNLEQIRGAARLAQIDEEIMALPMRYYTVVGDLGTSLSAGQRQRVLLARALYRSPVILIVDEGTANVDVQCEARIADMLRTLSVTRIVVTHSPLVASVADRRILLESGRATELTGQADAESVQQDLGNRRRSCGDLSVHTRS